MQASEFFRSGDLDGALAQLTADVRRAPADAKLRVFLCQLLMVNGDWERAVKQLEVAAELDAAAIPMARAYAAAIRCERLRGEVFAGRRTPLLFGEPEPWVAMLVQALGVAATGHATQAAELRARAFEAAPATPGTLDGKPFEWLADADGRLGPVLEALVEGRYYWVPYAVIKQVRFEAPVDARDLVWLPAQFTWVNGGEATGFVPARYPGSERAPDARIRLARYTEWQPMGGDAYEGIGQRMLITDAAEVGLLEVRELALGSP